MYTNADLEISLYVCVNVKIIPWKFHILNPRILELYTRKVYKMFTNIQKQ